MRRVIAKKAPPATENEAVNQVKELLRSFKNIVCQDGFELDSITLFFKDIQNKFRLGHTSTLRYIELNRADLKDKIHIDEKWLLDFEEAAANPKRKKFRRYTFKE